MNYKVHIQYDGTNFFGWAKQPNKRTVQEEIEKILSNTLQQNIKIIGSGRTDRGVHAMNQVFNFRIVDKDYEPEVIFRILSSKLPKDINVLFVDVVEDFFHAQHSAKSKTYEYFISFKNHSFFNRLYQWEIDFNFEVDFVIKRINEALSFFLGKHDFLSFSTSELEETIREIYFANAILKKNKIIICINGNGFLKNMVRMIVATCVDYAVNKINLNKIQELLNFPKKGSSIKKAPPQGLFLKTVFY